MSFSKGVDIFANDVVYAREIERRKHLHREWVANTKPTSKTNGVVSLDQRLPESLSPRCVLNTCVLLLFVYFFFFFFSLSLPAKNVHADIKSTTHWCSVTIHHTLLPHHQHSLTPLTTPSLFSFSFFLPAGCFICCPPPPPLSPPLHPSTPPPLHPPYLPGTTTSDTIQTSWSKSQSGRIVSTIKTKFSWREW